MTIDEKRYRPRGLCPDADAETEDRIIRIVNAVRLPPGVEILELDDCSFNFEVASWKAPQLGRHREPMWSVPVIEWPSDWSGELWVAADNPAVPDRDVARMIVAEIAAAAAAAVMHEFTEWAELDDRRLWDAHPYAGAICSPYGARALIRQVRLGGWPKEEN